jgi:hypothetical protein
VWREGGEETEGKRQRGRASVERYRRRDILEMDGKRQRKEAQGKRQKGRDREERYRRRDIKEKQGQ